MPANHLKLTIVLLFVPLAFGQTPADPMQDRVLSFNHVTNPWGYQEITNTVRAVAGIRQVTLDAAQRTLSLHGTADQIALAAWLFASLDQADGAQPPSASPFSYDYLGAPRGATAVRVLWLRNITTPRAVQETANAVRGIADLQIVFPRNSRPPALAFRGTPDQVAAAEWLVHELDAPGSTIQGRQPTSYDYASAPRGETAIRVYYLPPATTPQSFQGIVNIIRDTERIQRVFPFLQTNALVLRATPEQADAAVRLLQQDAPH